MSTSSRWPFVLLALLAVVAPPVRSHAACDPSTDPDKNDIVNARAAVAGKCDCAESTSHRDYVRCAEGQANVALVNKDCTRFVKRCASRSICGRVGFVTCCRTNSRGTTRCSIKSDPAKCATSRGGSACVGRFASCCDACTATGCATTIACGPSFPSCNGDCPPGSTCANNANPPECLCFGTVTTTPTTCTTTTVPLCGNSCSPPSCCSSTPGFGCPGGQSCQANGAGGCSCVGPAPACSDAGAAFCAAGTCPPGQTCRLWCNPIEHCQCQ